MEVPGKEIPCKQHPGVIQAPANAAWNKLKEVGEVHGTAAVGSANNCPRWRVNTERKARQERREKGKVGVMLRGLGGFVSPSSIPGMQLRAS